MRTEVTAGAASAPPAAARRPIRLRRLVRRTRRELVSRAVLIGASIAFLVPVYWMVVTALKSPADLDGFPPALWPAHPQWGNFAEAVTSIPFARYLLNSLAITALGTLGAVVSNPLIAYGFSRLRWPGRDRVFYLLLATIFVPHPVILIALFDIFAKLGWVNTFLPLIVPAFFGNPLYVFLLRQFLLQIPADVSDAARLDGAREWQILYRVMLPLARPAIAVIAIFAAINAWKDFLGPLIYLQDENLYTLPIGLQFFRAEHAIQTNLLMAASTLIVIPEAVIFFCFQRAFVEGITVGSVR